MLRKIGIPALLAVVICVAAVLAITSSTPKETYEFNASPQEVIIFADVQQIPGPPRDSCPHVLRPVLRVWGDGLTYVDNRLYDQKATNFFGVLSADQIEDQLSFLDRQGFLKSYDLGAVNPAGTWIEMGVNLKATAVKYSGGTDLKPQLLVQLIDRLAPLLQPVQAGSLLDERVKDAIRLAETPCN